MASDEKLDLDALAELERKATEGPWWRAWEHESMCEVRCGDANAHPALIDKQPLIAVFKGGIAGVQGHSYNAQLAASLRSHARTLIAEARRAREYRDALVKLIDAHGDHDTEAFWHVKAECRALLRREDDQ